MSINGNFSTLLLDHLFCTKKHRKQVKSGEISWFRVSQRITLFRTNFYNTQNYRFLICNQIIYFYFNWWQSNQTSVHNAPSLTIYNNIRYIFQFLHLDLFLFILCITLRYYTRTLYQNSILEPFIHVLPHFSRRRCARLKVVTSMQCETLRSVRRNVCSSKCKTTS